MTVKGLVLTKTGERFIANFTLSSYLIVGHNAFYIKEKREINDTLKDIDIQQDKLDFMIEINTQNIALFVIIQEDSPWFNKIDTHKSILVGLPNQSFIKKLDGMCVVGDVKAEPKFGAFIVENAVIYKDITPLKIEGEPYIVDQPLIIFHNAIVYKTKVNLIKN